MKAVVVEAFGGPERLILRELGDPKPDYGQVVIEVEAVGVGLLDVLQRKGQLGAAGPGFVPGVEAAGRVIAVGREEDGGWLGKRVFAQGSGGYAEQFLVAASNLIALPDTLSADAAVALGVNALVAHFSLQRAQLRSSENVLVRGANGGIGLTTVQMALLRGAKVTVIANSGAAARLSALGVHQVHRRDLGTDFAGSFDVIIDPVGGFDTPGFVGKLSPNGRYVLNGAAGGFPPADFGMALLQTFFGSPSFSMFSLNSVAASDLVKAGQSIFNDVLQGFLIPQVSDIFSLADAAKAHSALESGKRFGKIVLRP